MTRPPDARRRFHLGVAEQGKLYALQGRHDEALIRYRRAMHLVGEDASADVFLRHYVECSLESLELMGAYEEVIEHCHRALEHYELQPPTSGQSRRHQAAVLQRLGMNLFKAGRRREARDALRRAVDRGGEHDAAFTPSLIVGRWLDGGRHVTVARVTAEQRRLSYFSVRASTVQRSLALELPEPPGKQPTTLLPRSAIPPC